VLLGLKKRGFGEGLYNGFGGKVEDSDKSIKSAAIRELKEESGLQVEEDNLTEVARLIFTIQGIERTLKAHVFIAAAWKNHEYETEEMIPKWFKFHAIPFDQMWADDSFWLERVIHGESLTAQFSFESDQKTIVDKRLTWNTIEDW